MSSGSCGIFVISGSLVLLESVPYLGKDILGGFSCALPLQE
jgi:hypothetical protein